MSGRKRKQAEPPEVPPSNKLRDERSEAVLNVFDSLRQNGIEDEVPLPQLIVGGDTSSGKSSVLQRLTGISFPSGSGVVTRFATEVAMRPADTKEINVQIIADKARQPSVKRALREFDKTMKTTEDFQKVYKAAAKLLEAQHNKQTLLNDGLRIEVRGPDQPPLTVVDLPGLIQATSSTVSILDKQLSHSIVEEYFKNHRAIILAIVAADNAVFNQAIMDKAEKADPSRDRTIGVITKPDAVMHDDEKEDEWIRLARNEEIILQRGWHVLMNKAGNLKDPSPEELAEAETLFFEDERFSSLDPGLIGLDNLRNRVITVVHETLIAALPGLEDEFQKKRDKAEVRLTQLGSARKDPDSQRRFMIQLGSKFNSMASAAINGTYSDRYFDDADSGGLTAPVRKLRAQVEVLKIDYARAMRLFSAPRRIERATDIDTNPPDSDDREKQRNYSEWSIQGEANTREQALCWVRDQLERSRGTELPSTVNPVLIAQLFRQLSKNWESLTRDHVQGILQLCKSFITNLLSHITGEDATDKWEKSALERLAEIAEDERRDPMTYNATLEVLVQRADTQRTVRQVEAIVTHQNEAFHGYRAEELRQGIDFEALASSVEVKNCRRPDMDKSAAEKALDLVNAYYYTSITFFIEAVAKQVIETQLVQRIPEMLSMDWVGRLTNEELKKHAAGPAKVSIERQQVEETMNKMQFAFDKFRDELGHFF